MFPTSSISRSYAIALFMMGSRGADPRTRRTTHRSNKSSHYIDSASLSCACRECLKHGGRIVEVTRCNRPSVTDYGRAPVSSNSKTAGNLRQHPVGELEGSHQGTVHSAFGPPSDRLCAGGALAGDHPYQAYRVASRVHQGTAP